METPQRPQQTPEQISENSSSRSFVIKVKLLTNEVYEFPIEPDRTLVSDLKQMIVEKIKVPYERQRIVFGGKQLIDSQLVTNYVKQSGMTVHLIAKAVQQPADNQPRQTSSQNNNPQSRNNLTGANTANNNQNQNPQNQNTQSQNTQNQTFGFQNFSSSNNPFGNIFSMMGGSLGSPQTTSVTFGNVSDLNGILGSLMGNLGGRASTSNTSRTNLFQTPPNNGRQRNTVGTNPFGTQTQGNQGQNQGQQGQNQRGSGTNEGSESRFNVSNQPLLSLNQTISTLNLPNQPVLDNSHLTLREQTSQYLRRLQHMYMRMMPKLNRCIYLLNEGHTSHLPQALRLFQSLQGANRHAEEALCRLIDLESQQPQQNQTSQSNENRQDSQNNPISLGSQRMDQETGREGNIQATIIIQQQEILDPDIDEEPTNFRPPDSTTSNANSQGNQRGRESPNQTQQVPLISQNVFATEQRSNTQPESRTNQTPSNQPPSMGGLNLGGLMSILGGQNTQTQGSSQGSQISQGQFDIGGLVNMASMFLRPSTQAASQSTSQQNANTANQFQYIQPRSAQTTQRIERNQNVPQPQMDSQVGFGSNSQNNPPTNQNSSRIGSSQNVQNSTQNPFGGINLMGIFNSLQQNGGMGELMNMSLGEMLEEGSEPGIYSTLFRSFVGSDILSCFTTKNFDFLDNKHNQIRENLNKASNLAGSEQKLIERLAEDFSQLLVPRNRVSQTVDCLASVNSLARRGFAEVIDYTHNSRGQKYSKRVVQSFKKTLCEGISRVVTHIDESALHDQQTAEQVVFQNIKQNCIELMNDFIPGLAGMFYSFIERDLVRVYGEYKQELERKAQQSASEAVSEQQLLASIKETSRRDIGYLREFQHSVYYRPKGQ